MTVLERINRQVDLLRSTAALLETQPALTRQQFRGYADRQNLGRNFSGVLGLGFTARVPWEKRNVLVQKMRAEGQTAFRFSPPEPRNELHAIVFLEPEVDPNTKAIGYDMDTDPVRREAMARARDTGKAAVSGRVVLVQDAPEVKPATRTGRRKHR